MSRPELREGSEGDDVRFLQERLVEHLRDDGVRLSAIDGDFGPITRGSVERLQELNGLPADGIVGDATWAVLEADPSASGSGSGGPPAPTTLRMRPLDLGVPWKLQLHYDQIDLQQLNLQLSNFDLRTEPAAQFEFLQPVGRLFGNGGIEAINLEVKSWPNWFLTWSVEGVVDWSDRHGLVLGADNELEIGVRPLRGVDITATGNLDLRWHPMDGTGSVEPSGSIMINLDILELLPSR